MSFREIRTSERITDEDKKRREKEIWENGAGQIKSDITVEEANGFWNNLFGSFEEEN